MAANSQRLFLGRSLVLYKRRLDHLTKTIIHYRNYHVTSLKQYKSSFSTFDKKFHNYTEQHWRKHLTPEQYGICREKGTEPPWSGEFLNMKDSGIYCCVCCGAHLFSSCTKYDSHSGWPSFWAAIENKSEKNNKYNSNIEETMDHSYGMVRTEVQCKQCGSHLGHVFQDGPKPTGLRYCINSLSLNFKPRKV